VRIAGIEKNSFVDYPGRLAAVFFTPGCNWRCFYCHNRSLLGPQSGRTWLDAEAALAWLDERRGWLDAVVITGGEPTLQPDLAEFVRTVRAKGFLVKLDTNGTRPDVLRTLLDEGLLDYVAMDVKAPIEKYETFCGVPVDHRAVNESIDLLMASEIQYEFRTTVAPQLTEDDLRAIAARIRGARCYVLQQFRRPEGVEDDPRLDVPTHESTWAWPLLPELETIVERCETRGFDLTACEEMHGDPLAPAV